MPAPPAPDAHASPAPTPKHKSGVRAALEYSGIPPSWLDKRPRLPSRNWLIFLGVTSSAIASYAYDRRECRRIREEYKARVAHLAQEPLGSLEYPRKVTVYAAKWPGDDEWDRGARYFRKYVKPVLVAAAVDYDIIAGRRHGDIATRIANDIKAQRRYALGLDPPPPLYTPLAYKDTPEERERRALDGGTVIVGRPTFKEYMAGLRRGWTEGLQKVDREESLSAQLEDDGHFDEPEPQSAFEVETLGDDEPLPTKSRLPPSRPGVFNPLTMRAPEPAKSKAENQDCADVPPPERIPLQPPLLLVPFTNHLGIKQIPHMMWDFFNERKKVQAGAEAGYRLVMRHTRPFIAPPVDTSDLSDATVDTSASDLAFDVSAEAYYKSSTASLPAEIEKARKAFYDALPAKLATARALARGEREPTKEELNAPPQTEVELRAERLKKEMRWRADEEGWEIVKPESPVEWDPRFDGALSVFVDPPTTLSAEGAQTGEVAEQNS